MKELYNKSGIYSINNKLDNKKYIGFSTNLYNTFANNKTRLKSGTHQNIYLQSAYNENGVDNFEVEVLEQCEEKLLKTRKVFWINYYNTLESKFGYNLSYGGGGNGLVGEQHPMFSATTYTFYHDEYEPEVNKTKHYMYNRYDITPQDINGLCNNSINNSKGWRLTPYKDAIKGLPTKKEPTTYTLINKSGEKLINKTVKELCILIDVSVTTIYKVISGSQKQTKGWTTGKKIESTDTNKIIKLLSFINTDGRRMENITLVEMKKRYRLTKSHAENMMNGKAKSAKGWKLLPEK